MLCINLFSPDHGQIQISSPFMPVFEILIGSSCFIALGHLVLDACSLKSFGVAPKILHGIVFVLEFELVRQ